MLRFIVHYGIHFLFPFLISYLFFKKDFLKIGFLLLLGMLIDFDHLLATPVFDANRCSIGFHPLHSYIAIGIYAILFAIKKTRLIGLALLIHILADVSDCIFMYLER
ncbi:hypothetical protein GTQ40_02665 [Flavobacteriaceae bacterium R38]|nr:hypothetical protein [Flavobacteriaceae bacterium R38]